MHTSWKRLRAMQSFFTFECMTAIGVGLSGESAAKTQHAHSIGNGDHCRFICSSVLHLRQMRTISFRLFLFPRQLHSHPPNGYVSHEKHSSKASRYHGCGSSRLANVVCRRFAVGVSRTSHRSGTNHDEEATRGHRQGSV